MARRKMSLRFVSIVRCRMTRAGPTGSSPLTNRAEPRAPPALHDAPDRAAGFVVAGLALAPVDMEARGEIAEPAGGLPEICLSYTSDASGEP